MDTVSLGRGGIMGYAILLDMLLEMESLLPTAYNTKRLDV